MHLFTYVRKLTILTDVGALESWLIASPCRPAFHLTSFYLSNGDKIVDLQDHADTFCAQGDFRGVHE